MESNRQVRPKEQLKRGSFINTSKKYLLIGFEFTSNKNAPALELLAYDGLATYCHSGVNMHSCGSKKSSIFIKTFGNN